MLTIDNATERMDSTAAMEYSKDNGASWITCLDDMDLSDLTNATLLVRYACDGTKPASEHRHRDRPQPERRSHR